MKKIIIILFLALSIYSKDLPLDYAQNILSGYQDAFRTIANNTLPAVVFIDVIDQIDNKISNIFSFNGQNEDSYQKSSGSGIIFKKTDDKIYIVTNYHVVGNDKSIINIKLKDDREFKANFVGGYQRLDISILSIDMDDTKDIKLAKFGDSSELRAGDIVLAIGNPFGFSFSISQGIVSAIHRKVPKQISVSNFTDYIQTDAAINSGNSGGPLINIRGEVIGINSWHYTPSGADAGIGFAVPIDNIKNVINQIVDTGKVTYGWLGVTLTALSDDIKKAFEIKNGALISNVVLDSPALKALNPGDVILAIDGKNIDDDDDLINQVALLEVNKTYDFKVLRNKNIENINIKINARSEENNNPIYPGISVTVVDNNLLRYLYLRSIISKYDLNLKIGDIIITAVSDTSNAKKAGFQVLDKITKINNNLIKDLASFYSYLSIEKSYKFEIERQGKNKNIELKK